MSNRIKYITTTLLFTNWESSKYSKPFLGSIDYWEQEAQAKRIHPPMPVGVFQITGKENEIENIGTPPSSYLKVIHDPSFITIDEIIKYMARFGIKTKKT
ncbi:hypothetical protein KKG22_00595 [Patescibacteria group bacterium]|nr:hypothetical protein [Patescibacteria group bacterium]MBU1721495.1 hypothetical protein [Patescibacteria group bacterium]MBU1900933.1 hypothetical protein [Patescibacteria group bacterium]